MRGWSQEDFAGKCRLHRTWIGAIDRAYARAFATLDRRISLLLALPLASLDSLAIKQQLDSIGHQ